MPSEQILPQPLRLPRLADLRHRMQAIGAALLFGFATQLQSVMSTLNTPIQSNLLLMAPYIVTIIVLAGLVGKVRGPKSEGIPYVKS